MNSALDFKATSSAPGLDAQLEHASGRFCPLPHRVRTRGGPNDVSSWRLRLAAAAVLTAMLFAFLLFTGSAFARPQKNGPEPILLVVMDPLSKELACACVKGYGQRDYRKVAARIEKALKQRVTVEFSDDLAATLAGVNPGREVIVVGDQSLVAAGSIKAGLKCHPIAELTDLDGNATQTGSFIARSDDSVKDLKEIGGRKVFVGLPAAEAGNAAVIASLHSAGAGSADLQKCASHSEAALDVLDSQLSPLPLAVIPSWALPLLEGCGTVKPGNLKVIGKTQPMPFITVFVAQAVPAEKEEKILKVLDSIKEDKKLLKLMESRDGFRPVKPPEPGGTKAGTSHSWPDWRGPARDGHVPRLPVRLPATPRFVWKKAAMNGGLAGLSVSGERLILAERDFDEEHDLYRCLNSNNGEPLWAVQFPARGKLDYGQFPRATPVIYGGRVYLLGAFGGLRCVSLASGKLIWERQLPREFKAPLPTWGMCSTPLVVDDMLIVNPGGANASLVALDCATGRTRWATAGLPAAYSTFICGEFGGRRQIVGYDQRSMGGWDVKTGTRLWQLVPPAEGDFNVPTPLAHDGAIIVSTENNGTRLYRFDQSGLIIPTPAAKFPDLSPTTATPVLTSGRLFGVHQGLYCLDARNGLKQVWHREDESPGDHATLIADDQRVLVITLGGELILLDAKADDCAVISRLKIFDADVEIYSHPALVDMRLYARAGNSVVCVDLATN